MNKTTLLGVTALILCAVSEMEAHAQRTMRGESLVTAEVHYPFSSPYWFGADLSYGQYLLASCWTAGATITQHTASISDGSPLDYMHICAYGEWLYRLAGSRNRLFGIYSGAGAFLGYEAVDPKGIVPEEYGEELPGGQFLYGVQLSLEMEIFFCRRAALVIGARAPLCFPSSFGWFNCQVGAGVRINI